MERTFFLSSTSSSEPPPRRFSVGQPTKDRAMEMEIQQVPWWNRRTRMERTFFLTALTLLFVSTGLALALAGVVYKGELFGLGHGKGLDGPTPRSGESTA